MLNISRIAARGRDSGLVLHIARVDAKDSAQATIVLESNRATDLAGIPNPTALTVDLIALAGVVGRGRRSTNVEGRASERLALGRGGGGRAALVTART